MSEFVTKIGRTTASAVAILALTAFSTVTGAHAQEKGISPDELAQDLKDAYGDHVYITGGQIVGTYVDENGKQQKFFYDIRESSKRPFLTLSTQPNPNTGRCTTPIVYSGWAGYFYMKWCVVNQQYNGVTYEAKAEHWFYGSGTWTYYGSSLWDCDNPQDRQAMPVQVVTAACYN